MADVKKSLLGLAKKLVPGLVKRKVKRLLAQKVQRQSADAMFHSMDHADLKQHYETETVVLHTNAESAGHDQDRRLLVFATATKATPKAKRQTQDQLSSLAALRLQRLPKAQGWNSTLALAPVDQACDYNFKVYFPKLNLLYNEIPKNASSTLKTALFAIEAEDWLDPGYVRYVHHVRWQARFPTSSVDLGSFPWQTAFRVAFLRNPFDRVVSSYKNVAWKNVYGHLPFADYVAQLPEIMAAPYNDLVAIHLKPVSAFVPKVNGRYYLDFVGKFENFEDDFRTMLDAAGVSNVAGLPKINSSAHKPYRDYYDDTTRRQVARLYEEDIEFGEYTF